MKHKKIIFALLTLLSLSACGPASLDNETACVGTDCTENAINRPVGEQPPEEELDEAVLASLSADYRMPEFNSAWGVPRDMYEKTVDYYEANRARISNRRYVTIVDFNRHSGQRRFHLFDLANGTVERHNTSHGLNSDTDNDGYATAFSNVPQSKKSSLGFYLTHSTYIGGNGYSMRLKGLQSTNSNAESRLIVVHPANYVSNSGGYAGRSHGCPALDPSVSRGVIDRIKGGSLLLIDK